MTDIPITQADLESAATAIRKKRQRLADMITDACGSVIDAKCDPAAPEQYPALVAAALVTLSNERIRDQLDRIAAALERRDDS